MENILNFSPAWLVKPVVNFEADAIGDLRLRILKIALDRSQIGASQSNNNPRVEGRLCHSCEFNNFLTTTRHCRRDHRGYTRALKGRTGQREPHPFAPSYPRFACLW